jgi:predicted HTH transcriptional regulator
MALVRQRTAAGVPLCPGLSGRHGWGVVQEPEQGEKWGEKATATRLRIVQAMRRNQQISTVALAAELGMAATSGVEKYLKALHEAGCIRRVGPAKGGAWDVLETIL